jgi:hypothetical protein
VSERARRWRADVRKAGRDRDTTDLRRKVQWRKVAFETVELGERGSYRIQWERAALGRPTVMEEAVVNGATGRVLCNRRTCWFGLPAVTPKEVFSHSLHVDTDDTGSSVGDEMKMSPNLQEGIAFSH